MEKPGSVLLHQVMVVLVCPEDPLPVWMYLPARSTPFLKLLRQVGINPTLMEELWHGCLIGRQISSEEFLRIQCFSQLELKCRIVVAFHFGDFLPENKDMARSASRFCSYSLWISRARSRAKRRRVRKIKTKLK